MRCFFIFLFYVFTAFAFAQFPPAVGQLGTTAIHKDSSVFVGWASHCTVNRGLQDISSPQLGHATAGDSSMALGKAGVNPTVSLGDGGVAILTFDIPIINGAGWDFAVFENSFNDSFLELAFVEVSSDGVNYFRFPATSYTQDSAQVNSFGAVDATKINNLAGKYRALYGTPFDLYELQSQQGLDVNHITHIKIIDVVGSIESNFATFDQYGNKINDPWPTAFASGGFDLDAVGVIHCFSTAVLTKSPLDIKVYPNPTSDFINIQFNSYLSTDIFLKNIIGEVVFFFSFSGNNFVGNIESLPPGIYWLEIATDSSTFTKKLIKK